MFNIPDIDERVKGDFGAEASEAFEILKNAVSKTIDLNHPRVIRCIIFLAEKDLKKLRSSIQTAINDPRDVMFWAEYINRGSGENPKRIRDLNNTFDRAEINVKE